MGNLDGQVKSKKSFDGLHEAYSFFQNHANEADACASAVAKEISRLYRGGSIQLMDLGCGSGEFLAQVVDLLDFSPLRIQVTLVDPDERSLTQANERLRQRVGKTVMGTSVSSPPSSTDFVLANHSLYYVPDLNQILLHVKRCLRNDGTLLATVAKTENALICCWRKFFALMDKPVPYYVYDDIASGLSEFDFSFTTLDIHSKLRFRKDDLSKMKILMFCLGEYAKNLPSQTEALQVFDAYTVHDVVSMPLVDGLLSARVR